MTIASDRTPKGAALLFVLLPEKFAGAPMLRAAALGGNAGWMPADVASAEFDVPAASCSWPECLNFVTLRLLKSAGIPAQTS